MIVRSFSSTLCFWFGHLSVVIRVYQHEFLGIGNHSFMYFTLNVGHGEPFEWLESLPLMFRFDIRIYLFVLPERWTPKQ